MTTPYADVLVMGPTRTLRIIILSVRMYTHVYKISVRYSVRFRERHRARSTTIKIVFVTNMKYCVYCFLFLFFFSLIFYTRETNFHKKRTEAKNVCTLQVSYKSTMVVERKTYIRSETD